MSTAELPTGAASPDQPAGEPRGRPSHRPVFLTTLLVAAVFVGCKGIDLWPAKPGSFAPDLLVAAHQDLALALGSGLVGFALLRAARRRPRLERALWTAWVVFTALCVGYAIFSCRVYSVIYAPLTYRIIADGGSFSVAWSSVRVWFTPGFTATLLASPIVYVIVARALSRVRTPTSIVAPALQALIAAGAALLILEGSHRYEWRWPGRLDRRVADSPHLALAQSVWHQLARTRQATRLDSPDVDDNPEMIQDLGFDFPREDLADFAPAAQGEGDSRAAMPAAPFVGPPPRNVLVYVLESTSADYLDPYGAPYAATPRLAAAASHAVVFDSVSAILGKSEASLAGITLSTYVPLMWRMVTEELPELPGTTLAELLRPLGYRTALLSAANLSYGHQARFLANRGFDVVHDHADFGCPDASSWGVADACMVDRVLQWIDVAPATPFFVIAWTNQTHHPYVQPPDRPRREFPHPPLPRQEGNFDGYLNALAESDRQFGRLLDSLRERGLEDDTLVVITGDHGEAFGQLHPTFLHGFNVYQEDIHVPCIFYNPRMFPEGRHVATVGSHLDLNPSIAQILGVPPSRDWQGRSLFSPTRSNRAYAFATHGDFIVSVREGSWKYILNLVSAREELYNLELDPHEQDSAVVREPARKARLRQHLAAWMRAQKDRYHQGEMTMDRR